MTAWRSFFSLVSASDGDLCASTHSESLHEAPRVSGWARGSKRSEGETSKGRQEGTRGGRGKQGDGASVWCLSPPLGLRHRAPVLLVKLHLAVLLNALHEPNREDLKGPLEPEADLCEIRIEAI